jgi:hypothetical protein
MAKYGLLVPGDKGRLWPFVPALTDLLRRDKTTTTVRINATSPASPCPPAVRGPFQLDCSQGKLKSSNGMQTAPIPSKFLLVLKAMLATDSKHFQSIKTSLTYEKVATYYLQGFVQDTPPEQNAKAAKLKKRIEGGVDSKYLKKQAQQFKRGFAVWLRRWKIDIDDIVLCDRKDESYRLGNSWGDPPSFYASEVSLLTANPSALESLAAPKTGKTRIRSPDHDDSED